MWLWILSALIIILAWAAWFFFGLTFGRIGCRPSSLPQTYWSTSLPCTTTTRKTMRSSSRPW